MNSLWIGLFSLVTVFARGSNTIKTRGVKKNTIAYLRMFIIEIGSTGLNPRFFCFVGGEKHSMIGSMFAWIRGGELPTCIPKDAESTRRFPHVCLWDVSGSDPCFLRRKSRSTGLIAWSRRDIVWTCPTPHDGIRGGPRLRVRSKWSVKVGPSLARASVLTLSAYLRSTMFAGLFVVSRRP